MPVLSSLRSCLALVLLIAAPAQAQREGLLDIGSPLSDLLERQAAAGHLDASADLLPLSAAEGAVLLDTLAARAGRGEVALSRADAELVARYRGRAPATAFGRRAPLGLYADGVSPVSVAGDGYAFEATPLLYLAAGPTRRTRTAADDGGGVAYQNSRGFRVAGHLGRLFFETQALENQRLPALFDYDLRRGTTPRLGFVKLADGDTYDYFTTEGVVGYRDRFVEARFGRGRNRWGPGRGTLFLSDYAAPYDHLQVRASAGPVRYASTFARFTTPDRDPRGNDVVFPSKYGAFHQLVLTVGRVQLEAFEAVVFHDDTLGGNRSGFEIGYLNPVIFYRAVESELGSGDNALIGLGASVRAGRTRVYGQALVDEFRAADFFEDHFSNKWGVLAGVHAVDVAPGLEVRAEYARLRPYLYGHRTVYSAYVHYDDVLGPPGRPERRRRRRRAPVPPVGRRDGRARRLADAARAGPGLGLRRRRPARPLHRPHVQRGADVRRRPPDGVARRGAARVRGAPAARRRGGRRVPVARRRRAGPRAGADGVPRAPMGAPVPQRAVLRGTREEEREADPARSPPRPREGSWRRRTQRHPPRRAGWLVHPPRPSRRGWTGVSSFPSPQPAPPPAKKRAAPVVGAARRAGGEPGRGG